MCEYGTTYVLRCMYVYATCSEQVRVRSTIPNDTAWPSVTLSPIFLGCHFIRLPGDTNVRVYAGGVLAMHVDAQMPACWQWLRRTACRSGGKPLRSRSTPGRTGRGSTCTGRGRCRTLRAGTHRPAHALRSWTAARPWQRCGQILWSGVRAPRWDSARRQGPHAPAPPPPPMQCSAADARRPPPPPPPPSRGSARRLRAEREFVGGVKSDFPPPRVHTGGQRGNGGGGAARTVAHVTNAAHIPRRHVPVEGRGAGEHCARTCAAAAQGL
eukprot:SAG25_NODE_2841_length_1356_cov_1.674622_1_plen_269_part_00